MKKPNGSFEDVQQRFADFDKADSDGARKLRLRISKTGAWVSLDTVMQRLEAKHQCFYRLACRISHTPFHTTLWYTLPATSMPHSHNAFACLAFWLLAVILSQ